MIIYTSTFNENNVINILLLPISSLIILNYIHWYIWPFNTQFANLNAANWIKKRHFLMNLHIILRIVYNLQYELQFCFVILKFCF